MSLVRRTFTDDLREMDRLMERFFGRGTTAVTAPTSSPASAETHIATVDWMPAVDVEENDEAYVIKAEVPQVKREDVKINVLNGVLTLTGERRHEKEEKGKKFHRIERSYGSFSRSFSLPDNVDEAKITASFADGMLNILLPKSVAPKHNVRAIEVR